MSTQNDNFTADSDSEYSGGEESELDTANEAILEFGDEGATASGAATDNDCRLDGQEPERNMTQARAQTDALERCLVMKARPPREKPPWSISDGDEVPPFSKILVINEHP